MIILHVIILLLCISLIHLKINNPQLRAHLKIVSYAFFLSYYILSNCGKYPRRGIMASICIVSILFVMEYNFSNNIVYWGKAFLYLIMWVIAFSLYPIIDNMCAVFLTLGIVVLVHTTNPWRINWVVVGV